jgi:RNA polymerase sigma-B factor
MATAATRTAPSPQASRRQGRRDATLRLFRQLADEEQGPQRRRLRDEVTALNMDIALAVATRYRGRGVDVEDLKQVACLGLVKAVHAFRLDRGENFAAFAQPTIEGELKRHFRDSAWAVRPPRRLQELHAQTRRVDAALAQTLGHPAGVAEIADQLGATEPDVREAAALGGCFSCLSLSTPCRPGETRLEDALAEPCDAYEPVETHALLAPALSRLGEQELRILRLRFVDGLSQVEIGQRLGTSQMQISRLLARILARLRAELDPPALQESA